MTSSTWSDPPPDPAGTVRSTFPWGIWSLGALASLPWLAALVQHLWNRPFSEHFPLVFVGIGLLAWRNLGWTRLEMPGRAVRWLGGFVLALSWLGLALSCWLSATRFALWLACLSTGLMALGAALRVGGLRAAKALGPSLCMAALIVPPPFGLDTRLLLFLQGIAARGSGFLLDQFQMIHRVSGNVIETPGRRLMVEQACSGIESLMTVLPAVLFFGSWLRRPAWHLTALTALAVAFDLIANILRIVACALAYAWFDVDLFSGASHTVLGIVLFIFTLGLTASGDQVLLQLGVVMKRLRPASTPPKCSLAVPSTPTVGPWWSRRPVSLPVAALFAVLGVVAVLQPSVRGSLDASAPWWKPALGELLKTAYQPPDTLDSGRWRRVNPEEASQVAVRSAESSSDSGEIQRPDLVRRESTHHLGEWSRIFTYHNGRFAATVSIDFPFQGWHDLGVCYTSSGWRIERQDLQGILEKPVGQGADPSVGSEPEMPAIPRMRVMLNKLGISRGVLIFGLADDNGSWLEPPRSARGLAQLFAQRASLPRSWYQVQVMVASGTPFNDADIAEIEALFLAIATDLETQVFAPHRAGAPVSNPPAASVAARQPR